MRDDTFDSIVSGFYRGASGSLDWVSALRPFLQSLSAWAIYMNGVDTAQGRIAFSRAAGDSLVEAELDCVRHYHAIDPRTQYMSSQAPASG